MLLLLLLLFNRQWSAMSCLSVLMFLSFHLLLLHCMLDGELILINISSVNTVNRLNETDCQVERFHFGQKKKKSPNWFLQRANCQQYQPWPTQFSLVSRFGLCGRVFAQLTETESFSGPLVFFRNHRHNHGSANEGVFNRIGLCTHGCIQYRVVGVCVCMCACVCSVIFCLRRWMPLN